jgi:hypothetical protein
MAPREGGAIFRTRTSDYAAQSRSYLMFPGLEIKGDCGG